MDKEHAKPKFELTLEAVSVVINKDGDYVMTNKEGDKITLTSKTVADIIKFCKHGGAINRVYPL